jgi:tetratricopeptide (TPR) repeat protein
MRRSVKRVLLVVLAPALFLLLLEGVLALCGVTVPRYDGMNDPGRYWVPWAEPGKPAGYDRALPRNYKHFPEVPPLFLAEKPANGWRVFVLGESSVKGLPYETGCFSDWLRIRLAAMLPDRAVEVVNAGNAGWHATDIRLLLQECLEHEPDLLVWMVGHNEFVPHNVMGLRAETLTPVRRALGEATKRLHATHWLASLLPSIDLQRKTMFDRNQSDEVPCWGPELPLLKQRFREATAGAVADARAAGVPILLCTMPRNVREWAPGHSYYSDALHADPALRARWNAEYAAGLALLDAGDAAGALPALQRALAIDATPAKLHFALGRALHARGDATAARAAWMKSLEQDGGPMRAQPWAEQAIREVAAETRTPLVDLETAFDACGEVQLAGNELISDNCHPNLAGHELIASAILAVLERELHLPLDRSRDIPPAKGREQLGITAQQSQMVKQAESLNLVKLAVMAGTVDETWKQAHASCLAVLEKDPRSWEVVGGLGLLEGLAGNAEKARTLIEQAMANNAYVKVSYLFFWRTEPPYQKAFSQAGMDMAAMEAKLNPDERRSLENRVFRSQTR